jgi:hypothetical protein
MCAEPLDGERGDEEKVVRRRGAEAAPSDRPGSGMCRIDSLRSTGSQTDYFRPEQTIILFDWDDTLCPSTWIRDNQPALNYFTPVPCEDRYQRPLREMQRQTEAVLTLALKMGKVIIVTNAAEPWVETSCRNFMPDLLPLVEKIPIIYARSVYDSCDGACEEPVSPQRWKEVAFGMEISGFYSRYERQSWKNVVSIGDSIFERDAVRQVVLDRPSAQKKCRTKTAKLLDEPDIFELIAQVKVIHDALGMMVQHDGHLDIEIDESDLEVELALVEKIVDG